MHTSGWALTLLLVLVVAFLAISTVSAQESSGNLNDDGTYYSDRNDYEGWAKKGREIGGKITILKNSNKLISKYANAITMERDFSKTLKERTQAEQQEKNRILKAEADAKAKSREAEMKQIARISGTDDRMAKTKALEDREKKLAAELEKIKTEDRQEQETKNEQQKKKSEAEEAKTKQEESDKRTKQEIEEAKRRTQCKRAVREPSSNAGTFTFPVHRYQSGWYFSGAWSFDSRATLVGDFNGDGKEDYCRLGGPYIHFFISKGDGTFYMPVYRFPPGWDFTFDENVWTSLKAFDINGDGKADIVRTYRTYNHGFISAGSNADCWYQTGNIPLSCFTISTFRYPNGWDFVNDATWNSRGTIQGDFNADGKADFARLTPTLMHLFISKGDGSFYYPVYRFPAGWNYGWDENGWTTQIGDFNGDCHTDILRTSAGHGHVWLSQGSDKECFNVNNEIPSTCFKSVTYAYPNGWWFSGGWTWNSRAFIAGDFNGDGRHDYARLGGRYAHLFISKGDGTFYNPVYNFPPGWDFGHDEEVWTTVPEGDFDGDTKLDFVRTSATYHHAFFSRGSNDACWYTNNHIPQECFTITTFRYPYGWNFSGGWKWNSRATIKADFNGDGKADFANLQGPTYNHQFISK